MTWVSKVIYGLPALRACSILPAFRTLVVINYHFVLHVGRVKTSFNHLQASLQWFGAFDTYIILYSKKIINTPRILPGPEFAGYFLPIFRWPAIPEHMFFLRCFTFVTILYPYTLFFLYELKRR